MPSNRNRDLPIKLSVLPTAELTVALEEDSMVESILRKARSRPAAAFPNDESVRQGAELAAMMRKGSERALKLRIKRKELLTEEELVAQIGNRQWVIYAIRTGRLFSVQAPDGISYFPEFFVGPVAQRRALGKVAQVLAGLPGPSIFHFFTSSSFTLRMTPLEALAEGRLKDVLGAALGFAIR